MGYGPLGLHCVGSRNTLMIYHPAAEYITKMHISIEMYLILDPLRTSLACIERDGKSQEHEHQTKARLS